MDDPMEPVESQYAQVARAACQQAFSQSELAHMGVEIFEGLAQNSARQMVVRVEALFAKSEHTTSSTVVHETTTIRWPATWWQHWKEAHAPQWLLRRWPVQYRTQEVATARTTVTHRHTNQCPHLKHHQKDYHFAFLARGFESPQIEREREELRRRYVSVREYGGGDDRYVIYADRAGGELWRELLRDCSESHDWGRFSYIEFATAAAAVDAVLAARRRLPVEKQ